MFGFRSGSNDIIIYESIVTHNEYRLREQYSEADVFIDIGAHIGAFTYAAFLRGVGRVYAVEAEVENYRAASRNLEELVARGKVTLLCGAVWRSDTKGEVLYHSGYSTENGLLNTGGGGVIWHKTGQTVRTIPFDEILLEATCNEQRRIRLLKIDCEGAEWPILLTSRKIHLIDEICGEFHEIGGEYDTHTSPFRIDGFQRFTIHELTEFLNKQGFEVAHHRHRRSDGSLTHLGLFFASRSR